MFKGMSVEVVLLLDELIKRLDYFVEDDDGKFKIVSLNKEMLNIIMKIIKFFELLLGSVESFLKEMERKCVFL